MPTKSSSRSPKYVIFLIIKEAFHGLKFSFLKQILSASPIIRTNGRCSDTNDHIFLLNQTWSRHIFHRHMERFPLPYNSAHCVLVVNDHFQGKMN